MSKFNRFGNMTPPEEMMKRPYLIAEEPFKIAGNLYYVGNSSCATHLIDTGVGYIIIDTPMSVHLPYLINSMWKLGFDPANIKYIIISHAHLDHYDTVNELVFLSGAKVMMGELDARDMINRPNRLGGGSNQGFKTDIALKDGDTVELGNTKVRCVLTPGHTIGCMSHFWDLTGDDGKVYKVGIYGGAGFITLSPKALESQPEDADMRKLFVESIDKVWDEKVDIMLGNHPFHNDTFKKRERQLKGDKYAFIDPAEWHRYLSEIKQRFEEFCKMTQEQIDKMYNDESQFLIYRNIHGL